MATSLLVTETSKKGNVALQRVSYIHYPIQFKKKKVQALIDSGSEINAMTLAYGLKLGLWVYCTNVGAQKIDDSTLETFNMVLVSFQVEDKLRRARFFQETFLLANISAEVVLDMPFFTVNNANI